MFSSVSRAAGVRYGMSISWAARGTDEGRGSLVGVADSISSVSREPSGQPACLGRCSFNG